MNQRTHIVIPQELVLQIDSLVGKRGRSGFLVDAATHALKRLRQIKALKGAIGSWKVEDHPELKSGTAKWVKTLRLQNDKRLPKMTGD